MSLQCLLFAGGDCKPAVTTAVSNNNTSIQQTLHNKSIATANSDTASKIVTNVTLIIKSDGDASVFACQNNTITTLATTSSQLIANIDTKQTNDSSVSIEQIADAIAKAGGGGGGSGDSTSSISTNDAKVSLKTENTIKNALEMKCSTEADTNVMMDVEKDGSGDVYAMQGNDIYTSVMAQCVLSAVISTSQTNSSDVKTTQTATSRAEGASGFGDIINKVMSIAIVAGAAIGLMILLRDAVMAQVLMGVCLIVVYAVCGITAYLIMSGNNPLSLDAFDNPMAANSIPDTKTNFDAFKNAEAKLSASQYNVGTSGAELDPKDSFYIGSDSDKIEWEKQEETLSLAADDFHTADEKTLPPVDKTTGKLHAYLWIVDEPARSAPQYSTEPTSLSETNSAMGTVWTYTCTKPIGDVTTLFESHPEYYTYEIPLMGSAPGGPLQADGGKLGMAKDVSLNTSGAMPGLMMRPAPTPLWQGSDVNPKPMVVVLASDPSKRIAKYDKKEQITYSQRDAYLFPSKWGADGPPTGIDVSAFSTRQATDDDYSNGHELASVQASRFPYWIWNTDYVTALGDNDDIKLHHFAHTAVRFGVLDIDTMLPMWATSGSDKPQQLTYAQAMQRKALLCHSQATELLIIYGVVYCASVMLLVGGVLRGKDMGIVTRIAFLLLLYGGPLAAAWPLFNVWKAMELDWAKPPKP